MICTNRMQSGRTSRLKASRRLKAKKNNSSIIWPWRFNGGIWQAATGAPVDTRFRMRANCKISFCRRLRSAVLQCTPTKGCIRIPASTPVLYSLDERDTYVRCTLLIIGWLYILCIMLSVLYSLDERDTYVRCTLLIIGWLYILCIMLSVESRERSCYETWALYCSSLLRTDTKILSSSSESSASEC